MSTIVSLVPRADRERAEDANLTHAEFSDKAERMLTASHNMAGFFVAVWDDDGAFDSAFFQSTRSPYADTTMPQTLKDRVMIHVVGRALH